MCKEDLRKNIEESGSADCGAQLKVCSNFRIELPFDVISEILVRLPVESLLRSKCVCKLWCSQIHESQFIKRHMRNSKFIYIYLEDEEANTDMNSYQRFPAQDGLFLEKNKLNKTYCIGNYATKEMLQLPGPYKRIENMRLFYIPTTKNYKLVRVYGKEGEQNGGCEVLDFGTGNDIRWRYIDIPSFHDLGNVGDRFNLTNIEQMLFVSRILPAGSAEDSCIVYIDMETEQSGIIKIPRSFFTSWTYVKLLRWENNLALADAVICEINIWVLEDFRNERWVERKIYLPMTIFDEHPHLIFQDLSVVHVYQEWVLLHTRIQEKFMWYNLKSRKVTAYPSPPGKRYLYGYRPSLVSLQGFRPIKETQDQEVSRSSYL